MEARLFVGSDQFDIRKRHKGLPLELEEDVVGRRSARNVSLVPGLGRRINLAFVNR